MWSGPVPVPVPVPVHLVTVTTNKQTNGQITDGRKGPQRTTHSRTADSLKK